MKCVVYMQNASDSAMWQDDNLAPYMIFQVPSWVSNPLRWKPLQFLQNYIRFDPRQHDWFGEKWTYLGEMPFLSQALAKTQHQYTIVYCYDPLASSKSSLPPTYWSQDHVCRPENTEDLFIPN